MKYRTGVIIWVYPQKKMTTKGQLYEKYNTNNE